MSEFYFRPVALTVNAQCGRKVYIDCRDVEFSWRVESNDPDFQQSAYQLVVTDTNDKIVYDSSVVQSPDCRWIKWAANLPSRSGTLYARVRVFNQSGIASLFSECVEFETTLMDNAEWEDARWIWYDRNNYTRTAPSPYFRKTFEVGRDLQKAMLYVTARGVFEAYLNGERIGDELMSPGWTDFRKQIVFSAYDLTSDLIEGQNTIGALIADGWCCGNLAITRMRNFYHQHPEFLAKIELTYKNGEKVSVVTDSSWKSTTGPILSSDIYDGEDYDGRYELGNWSCNDYDDSSWINAAVGEFAEDSPQLVQRTAPAVRYIEEIKPVKLLSPKKDTYIWDFGQNFAGTFRVRFRAHRGRIFTFRTGEMLDADGSLYTINYRGARSADTYICGKKIAEWNTYIPKFTFHGFRYLQIDGFQFDDLKAEEIEVTGLVIHSDMPLIGSFKCGNALLSRLYLNALWGQRSNFLEIPTDCPQRDERLGWTGDAEIFASTAMLNMDCCTFYRKYLRDVRDAMREDGAAPSIAPAVLRLCDGAAAWGDAIVLMPYEIYRHYGWTKILEENFEAMKRSVDWQYRQSEDLIITFKQFGDWLAPEKTDIALVATAYFCHCTFIVAEIAAILEKNDDVAKYRKLASEIKNTFRNKFIGSDGVVVQKTQTAITLAVMFGLINDDELSANAAALEKAVLDTGVKLSTGFIGTSMILQALLKCGLQKLACDLLLQEEYPSWLFSVKQGATTIWERWNSYTVEDGFGSVSMNSFNHYAYGSVASFMVQEIGGIHYNKDGLLLQIIPDRRFAPVSAVFDSPYGRIESRWDYDAEGRLSWHAVVPPMLSAKAILPDGSEKILQNGRNVLI